MGREIGALSLLALFFFCLLSSAQGRSSPDASGVPEARINPDPVRLNVIDGDDVRFLRLSGIEGLSQNRTMPATGVAKPMKSNTATTSDAQRRNIAAVSPRSPIMVPTPTRLNPAARRRMSSPAPGQEFGKVENSLCTSAVWAGGRQQGKPSKG